MTISYPLTMPSSPGPTRVSLGTISSVSTSRSPFTFHTYVQAHQGQAWSAEITLPTMTREQAEEWIAFLLSLNGQQGTFYLGDNTAKTARGTVAGSPKVNANQASRSNTLATKGWTASQTNVLRKGDYIQVAQRLFKCLNNVSSDGSGNATIDIWPSLREAVVNNDLLITTNPVGLFRLTNNVTPIFSADDTKLYSMSFAAVEAL